MNNTYIDSDKNIYYVPKLTQKFLNELNKNNSDPKIETLIKIHFEVPQGPTYLNKCRRMRSVGWNWRYKPKDSKTIKQ